MFNPRPQVQVLPLHEGRQAVIVDGVLDDPESWRRWAAGEREQLGPSRHAYPGLEHWLPEETTLLWLDFFRQHVQFRLGMRRVISGSMRFSLVTTPPDELKPMQWLCHRDQTGSGDGVSLVASVLYLFDDESLGGTSIYRPRQGHEATERLVGESRRLDAAAFQALHPEVRRGYMVDDNPWFERVASLAPRFNRAVFYDGGLFHSGDIRHPGRMVADPLRGRLTVNAFIRCRQRAT